MIDLGREAERLFARYPPGRRRSAILDLLRLAQERDGHVTKEGIREVAGLLGLTPAEVLGVASFYSMLHLHPKGRHVVSVCHNVSCTLLGAEGLIAGLEDLLEVDCGETTADGEFILERAECLARCDAAPVVQIDYGPMLGPVSLQDVARVLDEVRGGRTPGLGGPGPGAAGEARR